MHSKNVRHIKQAIYEQAMRATRRVHLEDGSRVTNVRTVKGQLQAYTLAGTWINVSSVVIE